VTEGGARRFSRRGLLGIFGARAKGLRDVLEKEAPHLAPGAAAPPRPLPAFERKLRPPQDTVVALRGAHVGWIVDLRSRPLDVGRSLRVVGDGLAEPLLAARVTADHAAVVAGECPVDGSDLLWLQFEDRVACPSCGSRWRLDGEPTRGPGDCRLASFLVDEIEGMLRIRV
jgi:hypothetical protein